MFYDIDIMVDEKDTGRLKEIFLKTGELAPPYYNNQSKSKTFFEFNIGEVEVDVMAGFVIVRYKKEYDCSLRLEQMVETVCVNGEKVPLQSLEDWKRYYELMGRKKY